MSGKRKSPEECVDVFKRALDEITGPLECRKLKDLYRRYPEVDIRKIPGKRKMSTIINALKKFWQGKTTDRGIIPSLTGALTVVLPPEKYYTLLVQHGPYLKTAWHLISHPDGYNYWNMHHYMKKKMLDSIQFMVRQNQILSREIDALKAIITSQRQELQRQSWELYHCHNTIAAQNKEMDEMQLEINRLRAVVNGIEDIGE